MSRPNENLKTSQEGIDHITKWEGLVLQQYICPAGKPTIGYGHVVLSSESFPAKITKEQALDLLRKDLVRFESAIYNNVTVPLTQNQFDALVSFLFNVGSGGVIGTGVQRELNSGNYNKVPDELMKWCKFKVGNEMKINVGLQNRRKSEVELFTKNNAQQTIPTITVTTLWNKNLLLEVQTRLKKLGLYKSIVDGINGPMTLKAINEFAVKNSIVLNSDTNICISNQFLDKLKSVVG